MTNEWSLSRILLVEDNLADICLLRLALKDAGLDVELTVLHDGAEALAFVKRQGKYANAARPDLVVLDFNLPKNSGSEVLAALRSSEHMRNVPAVVMTSIASPHDLARAQVLGIECQLVKPLDFKEFLRIGIVLRDIVLKFQRSSGQGTRRQASGL